jgi:sugar phosphate isomerase/epimerase
MKSAITVSLVPEAQGGPFVYWDDLAKACESASALGFDGIEIFAPSAGALPVEELRALLQTHRLALAAIGTGAGWVKHKLHLTHPDVAIRERAREFIAEIIDLAGALGAPAIIGSMQGRVEAGVPRDQALDWLGEALAALGERSSRYGVPLFYEPLNRYETNLFNRAADAADFLAARGLGNVRLLCDVFHMNIEEVSIPATLRAIAKQLGHVHFADSNRRAVGFGHVDYPAIIGTLREIGYDGYLCAEVLPLPDSETAARQTITSFRALTGAS